MASARERAREADLLRFGLGEIEAVDPEPGEDAALAEEEHRLGYADTLRTAAESAREALPPTRAARRAGRRRGGPHACSTACATTTRGRGELADRVAELTYLLSDLAADVASYASGLETDPARLAAVSERRAALTALTRKYGETVGRGAGLGRGVGARGWLELDDTDERIEPAPRASATTCAPTSAAAAAALSAGPHGHGGPARRPR